MDKQFNQIERNTEFFAESIMQKYYHFAQEQDRHLQLKCQKILEVELKCCAYGYFEEWRDLLWRNFIFYLHELLDKCENVTQLKITFNGFDTGGVKVGLIIKEVTNFVSKRNRKLKVFWFHTNHLTGCAFQEATEVLKFISTYSYFFLKEISLVMNQWNFKLRPPNFNQLESMLMKEIKGQLPHVKFALQLSSWYKSEEMAYFFLQPILTDEILIEKVLIKIKTKKGFSQGTESELLRSVVQKTKMKFEKEISLAQKKTEKIIKKKQVTKAQSEQKTFELSSENVDEARLQQYTKKREQAQINYKKAEEDQISLSSEIRKLEDQIKYADGRLGGSVKELIWQERVNAFHTQQKSFFINLLDRMTVLEVFHIDMRNWHPSLQMGKLKNTLDTQVNKRSEATGIFNATSLILKHTLGKVSENKGAKKMSMENMPMEMLLNGSMGRMPMAPMPEEKQEEEKEEEIKGLKTTYMM